MTKLAIVGWGFVGKSVDFGFDSVKLEKIIIDPILGNSIEDIGISDDISFAFICVPTPMGTDGSIDASILSSCVDYLCKNTECLIIIKSTVTPEILVSLGHSDRIVYNPEFLTEKNAQYEFVNPFMQVFGGDKKNTVRVEQLYANYSSCKPCPVYHMSIAEASFVKYGLNSFLATKVLFFNQFSDMTEKSGADYAKIIDAIGTDPRVGSSHMAVPGHDGRRGFSGACFPKDVAAFVKFSGDTCTVLKEAWNRNCDYRNSEDLLPREKAQKVSFNKIR